MIHQDILWLFTATTALVVASNAWGGNCRTVRLPDGSYTTECPSEAPQPPPQQMPRAQQAPMMPMPMPMQRQTGAQAPQSPQPLYDIPCATPFGMCSIRAGMPVPSGTGCWCNSYQGPIQGLVP